MDVKEGRLTSTTKGLTIKSLQRGDSGSYQVTLSSIAGKFAHVTELIVKSKNSLSVSLFIFQCNLYRICFHLYHSNSLPKLRTYFHSHKLVFIHTFSKFHYLNYPSNRDSSKEHAIFGTSCLLAFLNLQTCHLFQI